MVARGADLDFYINGRLVWQGSDSGLASGRVGLEFFRDLSSRGNQFRVDWARLTVPGAEFSPGSVDPLQAAINRFGKSAGDERLPIFYP